MMTSKPDTVLKESSTPQNPHGKHLQGVTKLQTDTIIHWLK